MCLVVTLFGYLNILWESHNAYSGTKFLTSLISRLRKFELNSIGFTTVGKII